MLVSANMSTRQHKAFCVLRFSKCESIITVLRDFRRHYGIDALVYIPPFPSTLDELKNQITIVVESITKDMLQEVWNEFDYRLDVIHVTKGAHIEHFISINN
jgi:hypothetical protein